MDLITDDYNVIIYLYNNDIKLDEIFVSEKAYEQLSINLCLNKSKTTYGQFIIDGVYHKLKINIDELNNNETEYDLHFKYKGSRKTITKKINI